MPGLPSRTFAGEFLTPRPRGRRRAPDPGPELVSRCRSAQRVLRRRKGLPPHSPDLGHLRPGGGTHPNSRRGHGKTNRPPRERCPLPSRAAQSPGLQPPGSRRKPPPHAHHATTARSGQRPGRSERPKHPAWAPRHRGRRRPRRTRRKGLASGLDGRQRQRRIRGRTRRGA